MDFKVLGKKSGNSQKKVDLPKNIAVRISSIEQGTNDRHGMFHGVDVATNEPISVRLATIEEGVKVNVRKDEAYEACLARVTQMYRGSGEKHRPRVSEFADPAHKVFCDTGGLVFFTKCVKNDDGSYRAHWAETMDSHPGARCEPLMGQIRVEDVLDKKTKKPIGTSVVADCVYQNEATILTPDNAMQTLLKAFQSKNGDEFRKPFIYMRLINAKTGEIVLNPVKASAAYQKITQNNLELGIQEEFYRPMEARDSIRQLMSPENSKSDSSLIARAALHGFSKDPQGNPYPKFDGIENQKIEELFKITDAVRGGDLLIEIIPGERFAAGPATRASLAKAVNGNASHPFNHVFKKVNDKGFVEERMYTGVYLTTRVGKDGFRHFTKCTLQDTYPKALPIARLATANDFSAKLSAAQDRAVEASADSVVIPDELPFDASSLDSETDFINAGLADATNEVGGASFDLP